MRALNCDHCGRKAWYQEPTFGSGDMDLVPRELLYYRDAVGEERIERCPGCGIGLGLEEWKSRPQEDSEYELERLLVTWVLCWNVIEHDLMVPFPSGRPCVQWNNIRKSWHVQPVTEDLSESDDFAPMRHFDDAWFIIRYRQREACQNEQRASQYQRFLEAINRRWQKAISAGNLADGFLPRQVWKALLEAFDL